MDAIDSAMSAEQFQKAMGRMHHSPPPPGTLVRAGSLRSSMTVSEAARQLTLHRPVGWGTVQTVRIGNAPV